MSEHTTEFAHVECTCPRIDGYRTKRRTCVAHAEQDAAHWQEHDRRKFGTDVPHEPTDEFVLQAFAEGARALWPDSRDPGWHVTFRRWLAARMDALAVEIESNIDWSDGRSGYGDNGGYEHAARLVREASNLSIPPGQAGE